MLRLASAAAVLLAIAGLPGWATAAQPGQAQDGRLGAIRAVEHSLAEQLARSPDDAELLRRWSTFRHADAMAELVGQLPEDRRPHRLLYLAGGSHLAPLAICELLPGDEPCLLVSTDADPAAAQAVDGALGELAAASRISGLVADPGRWRFRLASRPVEMELRTVPGGTVLGVDPEWLARADLVIIHDWSGDPLECLRVVYRVLAAARAIPSGHTPMVMLEDLERHPYPIDLELLSPVARTVKPYGHRGSRSGARGHDCGEVGEPLFGGAVLLGLTDPWWRRVPPETLRAVLDLLLFNEFLDLRRNVLEGGDDPLLAPASLDWWTGFGVRTVAGADVGELGDGLADIARAAAAAAPAMTPAIARRLACRLQLMRTLAHALAFGADIERLMPAASLARRPIPGRFPNPEMEAAYRQSLRHAGDYRSAMEARVPQAARLAAALDEMERSGSLAGCPIDDPPRNGDAAAGWADAYRRLAAALRVH